MINKQLENLDKEVIKVLRLLNKKIDSLKEDEEYKIILNKNYKLATLLSILELPKNKIHIKNIFIKTDKRFKIPLAIQITTKKDYEFVIFQDEKQLIVDSTITNKKQSKVYNLNQAKKLIKEIITL